MTLRYVLAQPFAALAAAAITISAPQPSMANPCNNEGDTCAYGRQTGDTTVDLWVDPGTGDKRNVRTWINGNYQGQFESNNYRWTFTLPHNALFQAQVQSCWDGFLGSTCHSWAAADPVQMVDAGKILNAEGRLCLDAALEDVNGNGDKVQLWGCWADPGNQHWKLNADGTITNAQSGKCLDADLSSIDRNGTVVQLWDCRGAQNQKWFVDPYGRITNAQSGRCLDAALENVNGDGDKVQLWDCWADPGNQHWIIGSQ